MGCVPFIGLFLGTRGIGNIFVCSNFEVYGCNIRWWPLLIAYALSVLGGVSDFIL